MSDAPPGTAEAQSHPPAGGATGEPWATGSRRRGALTGWRGRLRRTRGGALVLKTAVFLLGLFFVLLGLALSALPGPLTIPPILLGVWIWSSEFAWADRLLDRARRSAREALDQARRRPVLSAIGTGTGLVALGVGIWATYRYDLVQRARDLLVM